jgi:UDP-N-acetylglucosamine transferase subunit ALG13
MYCFVTVGTTKFESLVQAMDQPEVRQALKETGFSEVEVQIGE